MSKKLIEQIEQLAKKAAESTDSMDAMRFSQAACNLANAMTELFVKYRPFGE